MRFRVRSAAASACWSPSLRRARAGSGARPRRHPPTPPPPSAPSVRFTGYVQARETYRDGVGLTGSINRARLTAYGTVAKDVTWRMQGEFRTGSVGHRQGQRVARRTPTSGTRPGNFGIQAGQFKTPFTREFITSLADVETADRVDGGGLDRAQAGHRHHGRLRHRPDRDR